MDDKLFTCLNGSFVLAPRAAVAVADRGLRYGDGLFETIRVERGIPCGWDQHMARLAEGLQALGIVLDIGALQPYAKKLLQKNRAMQGFLRLQVTRGVGGRGYAPYPPGMPATWIMEWLEGLPPSFAPCSLWLSERAKIPPQCLPTQYKTNQSLGSVLAIMEAQAKGCDEALQLAVDGAVSEASSANIFWLSGGVLHTPSLETGCLAGITRDMVIKLSPVPTRIVREGVANLLAAEAVFLTNSRVGIWPVGRVEPAGRHFGPHAIHRQLQASLLKERQRLIAADRARWSDE